jgi:hypothetical protein
MCIVKSKAVKEALSNQNYSSQWVEGNLVKGQDGVFSLQAITITPSDTKGPMVLNDQDMAAKTVVARVQEAVTERKPSRFTIFKLPWKIHQLSLEYLKLSYLLVRSWVKISIMRSVQRIYGKLGEEDFG